MNRTAEQYDILVGQLRDRIDDLEKSLAHEQECGRVVPEHQIETILKIRREFPQQSAGYSDAQIAVSYSEYCSVYYACGWIETNLVNFGVWAFEGSIKQVRVTA